jgi:ribosomal protein L37E
MRFYNLLTDEGKKRKLASAIEVIIGSNNQQHHVDCNVCGNSWSKIVASEKPEFVLTNEFYPDFMRGTWRILISERAKEVFSLENVTGYELKEGSTTSPYDTPAEFQSLLKLAEENIKKMPVNPPTYHVLETQGEVSLHEKSALDIFKCSACGYTKVSSPGYSVVVPDHPKYVDKNTWNGNDLFQVQYVNNYCCSERFYEIYQKYQLTGLYFKEIPGI